MRNKRIIFIVLAVLTALVAFVGCNSDVGDSVVSTSTISFAPTVPKALNQSGSATMNSVKVEDYHWKYYCSEKDPVSATDADWKEFNDKAISDTGLGVIPDLMRGNSYYLGLRGYTTNANSSYTDANLIWEGYHTEDSTSRTPVKVVINTKRQLITVNVYSVGTGSLYFAIEAPMVTSLGFTSGTTTPTHPDQFVYSYESLDGVTSGSNVLTNTSWDSVNKVFSYADDADKPVEMLPAGVYLFTIQQQTWNPDAADFAGAYEDIPERSQILIVNIVSGVDTVIAGSLDSYAIVPFDYNGYSADDQHGILLMWHQKYGSVDEFTATVVRFFTSGTSTASNVYSSAVEGIHPIKLQDNEYARIKFATNSDYDFYFNGDLIDLEEIAASAIDERAMSAGCYVRAEGDEKWTFVKNYSSDSDNKFIDVYAVSGTDYLFTVVEKTTNKSVSFTVSTGLVPVTSIVISPTDIYLSAQAAVKGLEAWKNAGLTAPEVKYFVSGTNFETSWDSGVTTAPTTVGSYYAVMRAQNTSPSNYVYAKYPIVITTPTNI